MSLRAAIKAQQDIDAGADPKGELYVTNKRREWLALPSRKRVVTPEALAHAEKVLSGQDYVPRVEGERRFTASRIGSDCTREVLFAWAGAPKSPDSMRNQDNMAIGSMLHLAWQIEGLSAGWLVSCETWSYDEGTQLGIKDDGILADDMGLLELKFVNGFGFRDLIQGNRERGLPPGPKVPWRIQVAATLAQRELDWCSLVVVNRENGEFREYRIRREPAWEDRMYAVLGDLHEWTTADTLPDMLEQCVSRESSRYLRCPYRDICPGAGKANLDEGRWETPATP